MDAFSFDSKKKPLIIVTSLNSSETPSNDSVFEVGLQCLELCIETSPQPVNLASVANQLHFWEIINNYDGPKVVLVIGQVPRFICNITRTYLRQFSIPVVHWIFDKYLTYEPPSPIRQFEPCSLAENLFKLLEPDYLLVNNTIMLGDFSHLIMHDRISVIHHPITHLTIQKAFHNEALRNSNIFNQLKVCLYDGSDSKAYKSLNVETLHMLIDALQVNRVKAVNIRYDRQFPINYCISAIFNNRYCSHLIESIDKPHSIHQRWKPSTKAAIAFALGVPLISSFEQSNYELCVIAGIPLVTLLQAREETKNELYSQLTKALINASAIERKCLNEKIHEYNNSIAFSVFQSCLYTLQIQ